jgi:cell division protein FtsB
VPLIKEYLEVSVKNDEHLVKLAAVVQRLVSTQSRVQADTGTDWILSEEEKKQLLAELDELDESEKTINQKVADLTSKQDSIESEINDIQDGLV